MRHRLDTVAVAAMILAGCLASVRAQSPNSNAGSIAARVVADRLVVRCDLASARRRIPVNLLVEFETSAGLQLHSQALMGLRINPGDSVSAHFPGFSMSEVPTELADDRLLDRLTKLHAPALGETALVGVIGFEVWSRYHVVFDLAEGFLHLAPPRAPGDLLGLEPGDVDVEIDETGRLTWFPVLLPGEEVAMINLGTGRYDTVLDAEFLRGAGRAAGELDSLRVGSIDLAKHVAFRPGRFNDFHRDNGIGRTGINLLLDFRIEVDRTNKRMRFRAVRAPQFPHDERDFFAALVTDDAAPVEAWLEKYPERRLSGEAAELLVDRRVSGLEDDDAAIARALDWFDRTRPKDLRATYGLELMDRMEQAGRIELVLAAGRRALEGGRDDRDSNAVHKIHGRMGSHLLERGDKEGAWGHLLSAAFGMKDDGPINLDLGRFYEGEGKLSRAFARYVFAVIKEDTAPKALDGLERVQKAMGEGDQLSIDVIERLVEGKVPAYAVGDRFKPNGKNSTTRCALVTYYTGAHLRSAIAADLAKDGVLSHFPRENVAVIAYHLPAPRPEPLMTPIAEAMARDARIGGVPTFVVDGVAERPGGGPEEQKEAIYLEYKQLVLDRLLAPSAHRLAIEAVVEEGRIHGRVRVKGPAIPGARLHLHLAEKGILFPGASKIVLHHMVARGTLIDEDGVGHRPGDDGTQVVEFSRRLSVLTAGLDQHLEDVEARVGSVFSMTPTRIDPRQVTLVAFLRDETTGEILQAAQIEPTHPEDALVPGATEKGR